jgi:hypothetical protein
VVSQLALAGVEFGYACDRGGQDGVSEEIFIREPKSATAAKISANDRLSYPENLSVVPVLLDNVACVAQSIATYEQTHSIYFAPETADRCIPLLAKARTVTLPLINGEHALLEIRLPQDASRRLLTEAYNGCRSGPAGKRAGTAGGLARTASEGPLSEVGPAANDTNARIAQFVGQYLQESGAFSPSGPGGNYADTVAYYGSRRSKQAVMADKLRYSTRWPTRTYALVPGSLKINPRAQSKGQYDVAFEYTFRVANGKETKEGRGATRLAVELAGNVLRISSEDGEVLQRY